VCEFVVDLAEHEHEARLECELLFELVDLGVGFDRLVFRGVDECHGNAPVIG